MNSSSGGNCNSSLNSDIHYGLPLDTNHVHNFQDIVSAFQLTEQEKNMLINNGFTVIRHPTLQYKSTYVFPSDISKVYEKVRMYGTPIVVTSDSLLHVFHTTLDSILKTMEEELLFDKVLKLTKMFLSESTAIFNTSEIRELREAARHNIAYFTVALKLLIHEEEVPQYVTDLVTSELTNIHSSSLVSNSPIFGYQVDYTQFTIRGHYSDSEKLQRYFKALVWYRIMDFKISNQVQLIQASLIAQTLSKNEMIESEFGSVKLITDYFVGVADDIGPYEFLKAIESLVNGNFSYDYLGQEEFLNRLTTVLDKLPPPKILGGTSIGATAVSFSEHVVNQILDESRGMRLIGQRYTPDSYIFSKLVQLDHTGDLLPFTAVIAPNGKIIRGFPRGLDAMAVLGSRIAKDLLEKLGDSNYKGYDETLEKLQSELGSPDNDTPHKNLYNGWLYSLRALLHSFNSNYPTFMLTDAWKYKELTSALASWTQLRHDTILYAKQSYTMLLGFSQRSESATMGYVEPIPELYDRILAIVTAVDTFISKISGIPERVQEGLDILKTILQTVVSISYKELQNQWLSDEEYYFIRDYGDKIHSLASYYESCGYEPRDTITVADVHTDLNSESVLEEGTGYLKVLLVAYKLPDSRIFIGAGPVLTYYEFKQPMRNRLNDESWKQLLSSISYPKEPEWISEYSV